MSELNEAMLGFKHLPTFLTKKAATSVRVHGLLVPAASLQSRLHVFGNCLLRYTHFPEHPLQLIGSATGLSYRGRSLLVCTAHQLKNVVHEDVGIMNLDAQAIVTSAGYVSYKTPEGDQQDICVFDYSEQTRSISSLSKRFFRLSADSMLEEKDEVVGYFVYGCPFNDQDYDVFERNQLNTFIRSMIGEPGEQPSDPALGLCRLLTDVDFDANGLSGGPVFAVTLTGNEFILKFAGVINRAGRGTVRFIRANHFRHLLDHAV